jgi:flagellar basal-body rod protein FlgG
MLQALAILAIVAWATSQTLVHEPRAKTQLKPDQSSIVSTNEPLDVAIQGSGFFRVQVMNTQDDGTAYTRKGFFFVNSHDQVVLGLGDGYKLLPTITIPNGTTKITIGQDGVITGIKSGITTRIGQIKLTQFANPQGLDLRSNGFYRQTQASGMPLDSIPGDQGCGILMQGFLESGQQNSEQAIPAADHTTAQQHGGCDE